MASVETLLFRARKSEVKGDLALAKALCRDVLARFPRNTRARNLLGRLPEVAPSNEVLEQLIAAHKAGQSLLVAEQVAQLLPVYPESHALWQIHGGVLLELGAYGPAETSLAQAVNLRPDLAEAWLNHSVALRSNGQMKRAEQQARTALEIAPGHAGAMMELASVLADRGNLPEASKLCRTVLAQTPRVAVAHSILGIAAFEEGRFDEARACHERAIEIAPAFAEAHRNLSSLKRWTCEDAQLSRMLTLHKDPKLSTMDRVRICFGLFDAFDKLGQPDRAWAYLEEGNTLRKALMGYDISQDRVLFDQLHLLNVAPLTDVDPAPVLPVFVLGMPRSGTTLTEQILSAHHQVTGAGELPLLGELVRELLTGTAITQRNLQKLRDRYLSGLAAQAEGAPIVIDKMPHNFCYLPLICAALPEARIVHVVREAASVCWSNLRQYFSAASLGYCYDLDDVAEYHWLYRTWTAKCEADWPGRIRRLDYATLTAHPERETRALVEDLGLTWDLACLSPQDNERRIHTASAVQVRNPVYPARTDAWAPYAPWVGEVLGQLRADC